MDPGLLSENVEERGMEIQKIGKRKPNTLNFLLFLVMQLKIHM